MVVFLSHTSSLTRCDEGPRSIETPALETLYGCLVKL